MLQLDAYATLVAATLVLLVRNFAVRAPTPAHLSCAREASRAHDS